MKIYGPVPSWRLGNSLGVDLIEAPAGYDKICSFDCVYCQLGHRAFRANSPKKINVSDEDFAKLKIKIEESNPDYITFSGEGEPTLNLSLGYVAERIKEITEVPIAVLTNASFINFPEVRGGLNICDLVIAKIDAPTQNLFEKINQPYKGASLEKIVQGLKLIETKLAIQTLLFSYHGLTNSDENSITNLINLYREINNDKPITIYLGTAYRPTDVRGVEAVSEIRLKAIAENISSQLGVEVVYYQRKEPKVIYRELAGEKLRAELSELLRRRPCTMKDISSRFGNMNVSDMLKSLIERNLLEVKIYNKEKFYFLKEN